MAAYGRWCALQVAKLKPRSRGKVRGGGPPSNRKGRQGMVRVRECLLAAAPELEDADITIPLTTANGEDLLLSARARARFNFSIEVKFREQLNLWSVLSDVERRRRASNDPKRVPVVFFKRAGSTLYAALPADLFLAGWTRPVPAIPPLRSARKERVPLVVKFVNRDGRNQDPMPRVAASNTDFTSGDNPLRGSPSSCDQASPEHLSEADCAEHQKADREPDTLE